MEDIPIVKSANVSFGLSVVDTKPGQQGCKVLTVHPDRLAGAAGIAIDDYLLRVNGTAVVAESNCSSCCARQRWAKR